MKIVKREPSVFSGFDPLFDVDRFFDGFFAPVRARGTDSEMATPRMNVEEHDDSFEVSVELPGVNKDNINVSLHEGILTISAEETREDEEKKEGKVIRRERYSGKYMRRLNLGDNVADSDIQASHADGVLSLHIPKLAEKEKQPVRIRVE